MPEKTSKTHRFWKGQIDSALKIAQDNWWSNGDLVISNYRDGIKTKQGDSQFNILWSNTEILKAATLSQIPTPNVSRTFKTIDDKSPEAVRKDEIAKEGSEIMERALAIFGGEDSFEQALSDTRDDMLLPGRGTPWIEYDADFEKVPLDAVTSIDPNTNELIKVFMNGGVPVKPDGFEDEEQQSGPFIERKTVESVELQYVYWKDFLHSNSRSWKKTWWIARIHSVTVDKLQAMFGKDVIEKLDTEKITHKDEAGVKREEVNVYEIWDKSNAKRIWYSDKATDTLDIEDAPLKLKGFYPCPRPLVPFKTNDTMVPVPEYKVYQHLAVELNDVVSRLRHLTNALRAVGIYVDPTGNQVAVDLTKEEDGTLVPVDAQFILENGPLSGQISWMPFAEIAAIINQLSNRVIAIKQEIFEITGIADIMRGESNPNESATAQRLKGAFGTLRLRPRRRPVEEMVRDIYRIMAEIIADKFDPETLEMMTGIRPSQEVMQLFRNDLAREFRIDIETDSTVQPNQETDRRQSVELATAIGGFFQSALPVAQAEPRLMPLMGDILKTIVRSFPGSRELEQAINETIESLKQPGQKQGDGEASARIQEAQVKAGMAQQDNQTKLQVASINANADIATEQIRADADARSDAEDTRQELIKATGRTV